jgi:hypothetical protein
MRYWLILAGIVVLGALVLSPVVAMLGLDPLPGDITFVWADRHIYLPLTQSLIASAVFGLLFWLIKK